MAITDNEIDAQASGDRQSLVLTERRDRVGVLTLNDPGRRNCLSLLMLDALARGLGEMTDDGDVHAIVLKAEGPVFCAGHDLKELTAHRSDDDKGRAHYKEVMEKCASVMQAIVRSPKPVVAAVQGTATAAGCQLVASTDLAVAAEHAKFCTPGVNIGLFCSTPMVALSRNVSRKRAMEMLLLGEMISAEEAVDFGLINRVSASGKVFDEAYDMARAIAQKSPVTVAIGKEAFYRQVEMGLSDAYDYAADVMVMNMLTRDAEEGIGAFVEKRAPVWGHDKDDG